MHTIPRNKGENEGKNYVAPYKVPPLLVNYRRVVWDEGNAYTKPLRGHGYIVTLLE